MGPLLIYFLLSHLSLSPLSSVLSTFPARVNLTFSNRWRHQGQSSPPNTTSTSSPPTSIPQLPPTTQEISTPPTSSPKGDGILPHPFVSFYVLLTYNVTGPNFITECFFLSLRTLHLGYLKTVHKLQTLMRQLKVYPHLLLYLSPSFSISLFINKLSSLSVYPSPLSCTPFTIT